MAAERTKARSRHDHCELAGTNDLNIMAAFLLRSTILYRSET